MYDMYLELLQLYWDQEVCIASYNFYTLQKYIFLVSLAQWCVWAYMKYSFSILYVCTFLHIFWFSHAWTIYCFHGAWLVLIFCIFFLLVLYFISPWLLLMVLQCCVTRIWCWRVQGCKSWSDISVFSSSHSMNWIPATFKRSSYISLVSNLINFCSPTWTRITPKIQKLLCSTLPQSRWTLYMFISINTRENSSFLILMKNCIRRVCWAMDILIALHSHTALFSGKCWKKFWPSLISFVDVFTHRTRWSYLTWR